MTGQVEQAVAKIVAGVLKIEIDNLDAHAAPGHTPGWDSIASMRIVAALEESLGQPLDLSELARVKTLVDLVEVVKRCNRNGV